MKPKLVWAVDLGQEYGVSSRFSSLGEVVSVLLSNAYYLAGLLILFLLILGGASIIIGAGSGDSNRVEKGKKAVMGAVIGFGVVFLSWFFVKIIETITGVNILSVGF